MNNTTELKMIAIACTAALASCAGPSRENSRIPVSATPSKQDSSLRGQLLHEVNSYRRNHGAKELQRHAGLDSLAQKHSEFLRQNRGKFAFDGKNVSHIGFEGRALLARRQYNMLSCAENVASTKNTSNGIAPAIVKMWAGSSKHENNMLGSWTHTGIGAVQDSDGTVFSTQLFGTISDSQMTSRNRFNGY